MENKKVPKESKPSSSGESAYLNREEFVKEMAKLVAAYPYFAPTELTWEVYWGDLYWVPTENLRRGLEQCRLTSTFFPSVADIIKNSIGGEYRIVPYNPTKPTTLHDIIKVFQDHFEKYHAMMALVQKQFPDADRLLKNIKDEEE